MRMTCWPHWNLHLRPDRTICFRSQMRVNPPLNLSPHRGRQTDAFMAGLEEENRKLLLPVSVLTCRPCEKLPITQVGDSRRH